VSEDESSEKSVEEYGPKDYFYRINEDNGVIERVNKWTGECFPMEREAVNSPPVFMEDWLIDVVCQRIANGEALMNICSDPQMPSYSTFCRWRRENEVVRLAYEAALFDRADSMRDRAVNTAEKAEEAGHERLKVDTYKWAASVDNPNKYSTKTKADVTVGVTQWVIDTGVRRPGDEGYFKDEASREVGEIGSTTAENCDGNAAISGGGDASKDLDD
jgi:hypothetical protein